MSLSDRRREPITDIIGRHEQQPKLIARPESGEPSPSRKRRSRTRERAMIQELAFQSRQQNFTPEERQETKKSESEERRWSSTSIKQQNNSLYSDTLDNMTKYSSRSLPRPATNKSRIPIPQPFPLFAKDVWNLDPQQTAHELSVEASRLQAELRATKQLMEEMKVSIYENAPVKDTPNPQPTNNPLDQQWTNVIDRCLDYIQKEDIVKCCKRRVVDFCVIGDLDEMQNWSWGLPGRTNRRSSSLTPAGVHSTQPKYSTPPHSPRLWIGRTSRGRERARMATPEDDVLELPHMGVLNGVQKREDWFNSLKRKGIQMGLFKNKPHHTSLNDIPDVYRPNNKSNDQYRSINGKVTNSNGHRMESRIQEGIVMTNHQPIIKQNHDDFKNNNHTSNGGNKFLDDTRLIAQTYPVREWPYNQGQGSGSAIKTPCTCPLPRKQPPSTPRIVRFAQIDDEQAGNSLSNGNGPPAGGRWEEPTAQAEPENDPRAAFFSAPLAKTESVDQINHDRERNSYRPLSPRPNPVGAVRFADEDDLHESEETKSPSKSATLPPLSHSSQQSTPIHVDNSNAYTPANSMQPSKNMGLVFLQLGDETKRAILPDRLLDLEDVRQLFIKAYPTSLNGRYLKDSGTIYIQDPTKLDFFYELDDLREVKDRSVLKLRDQQTAVTPVSALASSSLQSSTYETPGIENPPEITHKLDDEVNYFSESELDSDYRLRKSTSGGYVGALRGRTGPSPYYPRPASALGPHTPNSRTLGPPKPGRPTLSLSRDPRTIAAPPQMRSPFHSNSESEGVFNDGDSNRSSSVSRSGSVTPVVDEEARARMQSMEKQLAGLSSLVHTALSSKGVSESVFKDLDMLRREILGPPSMDIETASDSGSISRFSDMSSEKGSSSFPEKDFYYPPSVGSDGGGEIVQQIRTAKKKVVDLKTDVQNLKRMAQINAQSSRDILKDAFERVIQLVDNANVQLTGDSLQHQRVLGTDPESAVRARVNSHQEGHKSELKNVEGGLSEFEREIEQLRQKVVSGERRLRMHEVEHFTNLLTDIGRSAAKLKTNFPSLQHKLKNVMGAEMEKVVREEKFLKEEPERLDNALRRCKKLTNTMVTMKKLAMVQDPHGANLGPRSTSSLGQAVPPVPPPPTGYQSPTEEKEYSSNLPGEPQNAPKSGKPNVLDTLLEELQTVGRSGRAQSEKKCVGFSEEVRKARINGHAAYSQDDRKTPTNEEMENERYGTPEEGNPNPIIGHSNGIGSAPPPPAPTVPPSPADYAPARRNLQPCAQSIQYDERSRSGTPNSVNSEPMYRTAGSGKYQPPPPPPRSSSRSTQYLNTNGGGHEMSMDDLKHQLTTGGTLPRPRIHTNALAEDNLAPQQGFTKSASSSESVNSQDGVLNGGPGKAPPPPPPRNRQELLEQRHIELLSKQRHLQNQYEHLNDVMRNQYIRD